jgi:hypothetical protein
MENELKTKTLTKDEYRLCWSCENHIKHKYSSWLNSRGGVDEYAALISVHGGYNDGGRAVNSKDGGHSPVSLINLKSDIFKSDKFKNLRRGDYVSLGLEYEYSKCWDNDANSDIIDWANLNGQEIRYRVEMTNFHDKDGEYMMLMPENPIAFTCLYKSGTFGKGPCKADEVENWELNRVSKALDVLKKEVNLNKDTKEQEKQVVRTKGLLTDDEMAFKILEKHEDWSLKKARAAVKIIRKHNQLTQEKNKLRKELRQSL